MKSNLFLIAAAALAQVSADTFTSSSSTSSSSFTDANGVTVSHNKNDASVNNNGVEHSQSSEEHNVNKNGWNNGVYTESKSLNGHQYYKNGGKWAHATAAERIKEINKVKSQAVINKINLPANFKLPNLPLEIPSILVRSLSGLTANVDSLFIKNLSNQFVPASSIFVVDNSSAFSIFDFTSGKLVRSLEKFFVPSYSELFRSQPFYYRTSSGSFEQVSSASFSSSGSVLSIAPLF